MRWFLRMLQALVNPPDSLCQFPPDWYRSIRYPTETLMTGGIRIVDPFQGPGQEALWIDGRGRYTLGSVDATEHPAVSFADLSF